MTSSQQAAFWRRARALYRQHAHVAHAAHHELVSRWAVLKHAPNRLMVWDPWDWTWLQQLVHDYTIDHLVLVYSRTPPWVPAGRLPCEVSVHHVDRVATDQPCNGCIVPLSPPWDDPPLDKVSRCLPWLASDTPVWAYSLGPDTGQGVSGLLEGWPWCVGSWQDMHLIADAVAHMGLVEPVSDRWQVEATYATVPSLVDDLQAVGLFAPRSATSSLHRYAWRDWARQLSAAMQPRVSMIWEVVITLAWTCERRSWGASVPVSSVRRRVLSHPTSRDPRLMGAREGGATEPP